MNTIRVADVGYTILVGDCLILCGTNRDTYFKSTTAIESGKTKNMIRQYKSKKILLNNIGNHLRNPRVSNYDHSYDHYFKELDRALLENGFISRAYRYLAPDYYNVEALQFLIDKGYIKIIKISQELKLEED